MDERKRILLCEDDANLGMLLQEYLRAKGYDVTLCADGEAGYKAFASSRYDICVLDVMMPKKDGFSLARDIRLLNTTVPIIFLTARTMKEDVLEGFSMGADDYITKPFSMEELTVRIEAVLRRAGMTKDPAQTRYKVGSYTFDIKTQTLSRGDEVKKVTSKECDLLRLLCLNEGEVVEREYALKTIWLDDNYFNARSMDVYITKLRKLLKDDDSVEIVNVHGRGYKLVLTDQDD